MILQLSDIPQLVSIVLSSNDVVTIVRIRKS